MRNYKRRYYGLYLCLLLFVVFLAGCNNTPAKEEAAVSKEPKSESFFALDTIITVRVYDDKVTDQHFSEIKKLINDLENNLSRTISTSEISRINAASGKEAVAISDKTFNVVQKALLYSELSNGRFDITIGPVVSLWGIGKEGAAVPSQKDLDAALAKVNYKDVLINDKTKEIKLAKEGMEIDLGAIGKGFAADEIANYLRDNGFNSAIIDIGGNIFALGVKPDGSLWNIGVQDPSEERGNQIGKMKLNNKTIVTSGVYERFFVENGIHYHHILSPQTGYPVNNELNSVTIVTDHSIDADSLSTTVFALGLDEGIKFVEGLENIEAIFVTKSKEVYITEGLKGNFEITNELYQLREYNNK